MSNLSDRERQSIAQGESPTLATVRRIILGLVALGTTSMIAELLLVGHYEDVDQLIPLVVGGLGLLSVIWISVSPRVAALHTLQFVMLLYAGAGVIGVTLHFKASAEFQREIDPSIGGLTLVRKAVAATAPPALAPGLLVQLGLLGLLYTYRHPALERVEPGTSHIGDQS